jgi:acetyl-CoA synthetase
MAVAKGMISMMEEKRVFAPPKDLSAKAYIKSMDEYKKIYNESIDNPEKFWGELAEQLYWYKKWDKVLVDDFSNAKHEWFVGGKLNVSYNCLDRHLKTSCKNKAALIWEGEPEGENKTYTYQQLHHEVCKFANVLKKFGVKKGDRVTIYLPMIPELPIAMLACARIGAIHSVVFGGFSAESLRDRILDARSTILICCDGYYRSGRVIKSKDNADAAMAERREKDWQRNYYAKGAGSLVA